MPYSSLVIAYYILKRAKDKGLALTPMQIQKLVYLSHGWYLAFNNGNPLITDEIQAWQFGPVIPELYNKFKKFGSGIIDELDPLSCAVIDATVTPFLDAIVDSYGQFHAFQLSALTHETDSPWYEVYYRCGKFAPIPNTKIFDYFAKLLDAANKTASTTNEPSTTTV